jgi:hypothetical protein
MKKIIGLMVFFTFIFSACNNGSKNEENNADSLKVNKDTLAAEFSVDEFDSVAKNYVDKEIKVKGIVDHVCKHGGKKLFLVGDYGDLHVEGEEKFSDSLAGSNVTVTGIVREFRVDEAYCLQMEQDNIKSHSKGQTDKELFEQKKNMIAEYRDSMKAANVDHLSFYSLEYKSLVTE